MRGDEVAPSEIELELWEDSRLQCWDQLSSWDQLHTSTTLQLQGATLDAVWDDTWYMVRAPATCALTY